MQVQVKELAKHDIDNLSDAEINQLLEKIEELEDNPTGHPDVGLVIRHGFELFRMKITEGSLHHRALFDIVNGKVKVYAFMERPPEEYSKENLEVYIGDRMDYTASLHFLFFFYKRLLLIFNFSLQLG